MKTLAIQDLNIALALKAGTLQVVEREGRFGPYVAISDEHGIIEVQDTLAAAQARIDEIRLQMQTRRAA